MNGNIKLNNYEKAKKEADSVDIKIVELIKKEKNFRVEAGAGSGKTYSLNKTIEWLQNNKAKEYNRKRQNVVCITYTNAAVNVITSRLRDETFIIPSTIHSFAWSVIKQYQSFLIETIKNDNTITSKVDDFDGVNKVEYTLGKRYVEDETFYLHHNDVLKLFCCILDSDKYRRIFADKYPLILVDEYQDSYKPIIDQFIKYFISENKLPQFGFFGDSWQTIYQSNNACGLIENTNIEVINKTSNFRCSPSIVNLLNKLRPDFKQISAVEENGGEVFVITCDDFNGKRRNDRIFKDDLPADEIKKRIDALSEKIQKDADKEEKLKILMITHKVLANQQGYEKLLDVLGNGLKDKEEKFLLFFMEIVEPIFKALQTNDTKLLFDTLGTERSPIIKKSEKLKWKNLFEKLSFARQKRAIDVIGLIQETNLIPLSPDLEELIDLYYKDGDESYYNTTLKDFLELDYQQFLAAIDFLYPNALFSTEHGVKGEEYDNVIFAITKGWDFYKFDEYASMVMNGNVSKEDCSKYERMRNLFYVCCSRPKKRLYIFVSIPVNQTFKDFLIMLVGKEQYFTYDQFIKR
ncbi:MAG: AAA family ATPase [Solobacterium sp.]|nr:AAA family ATPase [Solobacterium sp.]